MCPRKVLVDLIEPSSCSERAKLPEFVVSRQAMVSASLSISIDHKSFVWNLNRTFCKTDIICTIITRPDNHSELIFQSAMRHLKSPNKGCLEKSHACLSQKAGTGPFQIQIDLEVEDGSYNNRIKNTRKGTGFF